MSAPPEPSRRRSLNLSARPFAPRATPPATRPAAGATATSTTRTDGARGAGIGRGITWLATWSLRLILIGLALIGLSMILSRYWSIVFPVLLALLLSSVLWPPTDWLRRRSFPPAAAASLVLLSALVIFFGILGSLAPSVADQVGDIATQAGDGLVRVQEWVTGPPLNLNDAQVDAAVQSATDRLQSSATVLASGVLTGVSAVTSAIVTTALVLVLTFFFLKDGPRFLPWVEGIIGNRAARHVDVVARRAWGTLASFIQGQAVVGLVDAVLIGIGLAICGVPLALPLAVLTFFGGFVPIIGAFIVGALAVLVALVTEGTTTALIVLGIIIAVQQIEGNVLQPVLQGRTLRLHPAVVILAVAAGGGLYGIGGAFLAVPVAAVAAVVLRYLGEVLDGDHQYDDAPPAPGAEPPADGDEGVGPDVGTPDLARTGLDADALPDPLVTKPVPR